VAAGGWISRIAYVRGSATLGLLLLVAANLVPVVGVLLFDWDVGLILGAYWLENGVVGLLNVPRIILASGVTDPSSNRVAGVSTLASLGSSGKAILAGFFLIHYGIFWVVHGVFLNVFVNQRGMLGGGGFGFSFIDATVVLAGAALFLSHLANLIVNYIGRGEYRTATPGGQMFAPYPRVIALHVTIILGGIAIMRLGQPIFAVVLLVILKTAIDVGLYRFDRRRLSPAMTANAPSSTAPKEPAAIV
jgi:hypothetical protein